MDIDRASQLAVENVFKEGLTDIFPRPQELDLLKNRYFRETLAKEVSKCIRGNSLDSLNINPIGHVILPKGGPFDFRRCALIHPLDTIKYLALVLSLADEIEPRRLSNQKRVVFSYRFKPDNGNLFDPRYNFTRFQRHTRTKMHQSSTKFLVSCDIGDFYPRLNLHRLESILHSMGLDKDRVRQVSELLLFWANRDSYGLPVGSNASRILAEASLVEVDNYMLSIGAKFCRWVDDYRLFAPDAHSAHHWLTQLIERLWIEGLTINKMKTKVEAVSKLLTEDRESKERVTEDSEQQAPEEDAEGASTEKRSGTIKSQSKIMAGYGGIIPTRFQKPSRREIDKLKDSDPASKLVALKAKKLPEPEDIKDFVKSVYSTNTFTLFKELPEVADFFPQFTPYLVDALVKHGEQIGTSGRAAIRDKFANRLKSRRHLPEYITLEIVRLLGTSGYEDKKPLLDFFRELRRNQGAYIGRVLLDALEEQVTRGEVLEIRRYFERADSWEKRQIVRIVNKHLSEDEKRPWMKNVLMQESRDLFLVEYIKPTKTDKNKNK
jgi:hypothetical protein